MKQADPDVTIDHWTDAPISQLSDTEATLFNKIMDWIIDLSGAKVFLVNTDGIGAYPYYDPDAKGPTPFVSGLTLRGNPSGIVIAADAQHRPGVSLARTLTHEGLHALIRKFGFKETRGKLRVTIKEYLLTEEQQAKYVEISHATYNDAVLTIITDPSYARLTDAQKAERLNAMRSRLAEVVRNEFLLWLSQNTTSTDREDPKVSKETSAYVKKLLGW